MKKYLSAATLNAEEMIDTYRRFADRLAPCDQCRSRSMRRSRGSSGAVEGLRELAWTLITAYPRDLVEHGCRQRLLWFRRRSRGAVTMRSASSSPTRPRGRRSLALRRFRRNRRLRYQKGGDLVPQQGANAAAVAQHGHRAQRGTPERLDRFGHRRTRCLGWARGTEDCTGYESDGNRFNEFPATLKVLAECTPLYETLPGWSEDISTIRQFGDLPQTTRTCSAG